MIVTDGKNYTSILHLLLKECLSYHLNMNHGWLVRPLSMNNAEKEAKQNLQFLLLSLLPSHMQHQVLRSCLLQSPFSKH